MEPKCNRGSEPAQTNHGTKKLWNQKTMEHNSPSPNHGTKNKTMEPRYNHGSEPSQTNSEPVNHGT